MVADHVAGAVSDRQSPSFANSVGSRRCGLRRGDLVRPCAHLRPSSIPVGSATPRSSRLGAFRQGRFVQTTHRERAANKFAASHGRQLHQAMPKRSLKIAVTHRAKHSITTNGHLKRFHEGRLRLRPNLACRWYVGQPIALKRAIDELRVGDYSSCAGKKRKRDKDDREKCCRNDCAPRYRFAHQSLPSLRAHTQQLKKLSLRSFCALLVRTC
jgi:hypothetical protein